MFKIVKDARLSEEAKILFNIQEILKEMNSKLGVLEINESQSKECVLQTGVCNDCVDISGNEPYCKLDNCEENKKFEESLDDLTAQKPAIGQLTEVAKEVIGEVLSSDESEHLEKNDKLKKKKG